MIDSTASTSHLDTNTKTMNNTDRQDHNPQTEKNKMQTIPQHWRQRKTINHNDTTMTTSPVIFKITCAVQIGLTAIISCLSSCCGYAPCKLFSNASSLGRVSWILPQLLF